MTKLYLYNEDPERKNKKSSPQESHTPVSPWTMAGLAILIAFGVFLAGLGLAVYFIL